MVETLERLVDHYCENTKVIVWEHNTHVGDARATPMIEDGMVNVGQLVREHHLAEDVVLLGFGAYRGSVIAGRSWGATMERMPVPEARAKSWEALLHEKLGQDSLLIFSEAQEADEWLTKIHGHRAIGVVYNAFSGWDGSFVPTSLSRCYDAFVYLEDTHALNPLYIEAGQQAPETIPGAFRNAKRNHRLGQKRRLLCHFEIEGKAGNG